MDIQDIIARLDGARCTSRARDSWVAKCPSHQDRSPSLSVAPGENGGFVLHCFAGCSIESVIGAIGLTLSDLMGEPPTQYTEKSVMSRGERIPLADILRCMATNTTVVTLAALRLANGHKIDEAGRARLLEINGEMQRAMEYVRLLR